MPGWPTPIRGSVNESTITGDNDANKIYDANGNHTITGGGGVDIFHFVRQTSTIDIITDFDVADEVIDLTDASWAGIHSFSALSLSDDNGDALLQLADGHALLLQGVDYTTLSSANFSFSPWPNETLYGSEGDDAITTGGGHDRIYGMDGNDTLDGGDGNDTLYGDDGSLSAIGGDDVLIGGAGSDNLYGEGGNDTLDGGDGHDNLYGGAGNDVLIGGAGYDNLHGGEGDDTLDGGDDHDNLYGGSGNDVMTGGAGSDTFHFEQETDALDIITDFDIILDFISLDHMSLGSIGDISDITITDDNGTAVLQLGNGHVLRLLGVDYTSLSNDHFQFFINYVVGYEGNETLNGSAYRDYINAYAENTVLNGFGGNDYLEAQTGNNTLVGGLGNDTMYGGYDNGVDTFVFEKDAGATDTIYRFFLEHDKIDLSDNSLSYLSGIYDLLLSDDDGDAVIGLGDGQSIRLAGVDYTLLTTDHFLFSLPLNSAPVAVGDSYELNEGGTLVVAALEGVLSNDVDADGDMLSAILVDDVSYGTLVLNADGSFSYTHDGSVNLEDSFTYNDTLYGGDGNDTLHGGAGKDDLYGGNGNDVFVFANLSHSTSANHDTIYDFVQGQDKIDLSALHFTNIHSNPAAGTTLSLVHVNGQTVIADDNNFRILLTNHLELTNSDFIF